MRVPNEFGHIFTVWGDPALKIDFSPLYDYSTVPYTWPEAGVFDWPHRGQLLGEIRNEGGIIRVDIFGGRGVPAGPVYFLRGQAPALNTWFDFAAGDPTVNTTGARMRFNVRAMPILDEGQAIPFVLIPTLADDNDVSPDPALRKALPGYDDDDGNGNDKGLAYWLAKAMRRVVTLELPSLIPHKFAKLSLNKQFPALAGNVVDTVATDLPDIRDLAAVDQIREMQAKLALWMAADSGRTQREFADLADATLASFADLRETIRQANAPDEDDAEETDTAEGGGGLTFGGWARG